MTYGIAHNSLPTAKANRSLAAAAFACMWAAASACFAQHPVSLTTPSFDSAGGTAVQTADQRDVLLMLDDSPVHLRLRIALGGVSLGRARDQYISRLLASLDQDGDGKLNRAEANDSPLLRTKQRPGAAKFLDGLNVQLQLQRRDLEQMVDRMGGEIIAYRQDLSSAQNDTEVFKLLDSDGSNTLDAAESEQAAFLIISKDTDADECVSFQEFFPPPPDNAMMPAIRLAAAAASPLPTVADLVRDTSEPLLPRRLIKKYDRNRDQQLDAAELGWTPQRVALSDHDQNGRLDAAELATLDKAAPDMELAVDLQPQQGDGGMIEIVHSAGRRMDDAGRPDYAKLRMSGAVVTFSLRNTDPIASAIESAMRQFNLLDADANGYLDKGETGMRVRFERGLFDLIDADGDAKLFADEMQEYVRARTEPAATTSRMNVYDTGYGFFMALDGNADGRVSVREMRQASTVLAQLDRDGKPGVAQNEPVRHFHIEFVRGGYQLFGPSEQLVSQTPAFQHRRPTGPIWFQRMDRNNDGDLTWNEFLGPREVFHELDADADAFIDPREAGEAK